jgi:hypothetical protein
MISHTHTRTRPVSAPAYYLGRPAGLWLTALTWRSATRKSPHADCETERRTEAMSGSSEGHRTQALAGAA